MSLRLYSQPKAPRFQTSTKPESPLEPLEAASRTLTDFLKQKDWAAVGGGGLVAGLALAAQGTSVRVIGVEAERSPALRVALDAGRIVPIEVGATLADGLAGNLEPGSVTVDLVRDHVAGLLAAAEDEIRQGIRFLAAEHGLVAEGSAAAAVAPLLAGRLRSGPGTTAIVLTGRNISLATLADVLRG